MLLFKEIKMKWKCLDKSSNKNIITDQNYLHTIRKKLQKNYWKAAVILQ